MFLEISKANLRLIHTVVPSEPIMEVFDRQTRPMYRKMAGHKRVPRTLAALRDALLPRPISGALRVQDAEQFITRAM